MIPYLKIPSGIFTALIDEVQGIKGAAKNDSCALSIFSSITKLVALQ
jgi:hypothetical protein